MFPPAGSPNKAQSIDYLLPGGITGSVSLHAVPAIFIKEVFAKPVRVLAADRELEVTCHVNNSGNRHFEMWLEAELKDGSHIIAKTTQSILLKQSKQEITLTLKDLENIHLWDIEKPFLYDFFVTIFLDRKPLHAYKTRIGFREAAFTTEGFFLNGRRLQLFGLNRHELYPYIGFSAPTRVLRKDAEILRHDFNCNIVRCSHYPQSEAFLDTCDELGLLVWEEIPGWQYIGDEEGQNRAVQDVEAMIRRDRNHASIVIWGTRINE